MSAETLPRLGFAVRVADSAYQGAIPRRERLLAADMPPSRAAEFVAGRRALHGALAQIGVDCADGIGRDGRRPRLPAGSTGSISHSRGIAVAVAGRSRDYRAVGVDIEFSSLPPASARLFLDADERALVDERVGSAGPRLQAAFSAKETAFKLLDPVLGGLVGLRDLRLEAVGGVLLCRARDAASPVVRVHGLRLGDGVLSWAGLPAESAPDHAVDTARTVGGPPDDPGAALDFRSGSLAAFSRS